MEIKKIAEKYTVSDQITVADVSSLADMGVELLICNRPNGEAADQTPYEEIAQAAEKLGIKFVAIPFAGGQLQASQVQEFKSELDAGLVTHAYCRTGNRCTIIWKESSKI